LAAPIPSGQASDAQASRFVAESEKRSKAFQKKNFDKKNRAGAYIEFKEDKVKDVGAGGTGGGQKLKNDAKD